MGENARKRLAAALQTDQRFSTTEDYVDATFAADPQLEADIEAGAALRSDRAERVLAEALDGTGDDIYSAAIDWIAGYKPKPEAHANLSRAILAALREGLRELTNLDAIGELNYDPAADNDEICDVGALALDDEDDGSWPQPGDMPNMAGGHEHWDDR